jgi:hypothetical protein
LRSRGDRARVRPFTNGLILAGLIALAAALRYSGIFWGLPATLHADEWVIVEYAIDLARRNSFEPAFFARPDHLEIQLSYLAYEAWAWLFHGLPPEAVFEATPAPFYAISRAITATFGTAMVPLAYLIGRRVAPAAGLLMATGIAIYPSFVGHSRYATPDIPLAFTVMLVILGCVGYLQSRSWGFLVLACFGVALGVTVKYPAALGVVMIAVAIIVSEIRAHTPLRILSRGSAAAGLVVAMTFFLSPVLFTNGREVLHQLTSQNSGRHLGASGLDFGGNLAFYAQQTAESAGFLMLVFAAVGVVWIVATRRWDAIPLLLGVVFWIAISTLSLHWERWALPMYVSVVLLAGLGVWAAWRHATALRMRGRSISRRIVRGVVAALAGVSGLALLLSAIAAATYALLPDSRVTARTELEQWGATAATTIYDGYSPFLPGVPGSITERLTVKDGALAPTSPDETAEFVMTSSFMSTRYINSPDHPDERALYRLVAQDLPVLESWEPIALPTAEVWDPARIVKLVAFLTSLNADTVTGPQLVLYDLSP